MITTTIIAYVCDCGAEFKYRTNFSDHMASKHGRVRSRKTGNYILGTKAEIGAWLYRRELGGRDANVGTIESE